MIKKMTYMICIGIVLVMFQHAYFGSFFNSGVTKKQYSLMPLPFLSPKMEYISTGEMIHATGPFMKPSTSKTKIISQNLVGLYYIENEESVLFQDKVRILSGSHVFINTEKVDITGELEIEEGAYFHTGAY